MPDQTAEQEFFLRMADTLATIASSIESLEKAVRARAADAEPPFEFVDGGEPLPSGYGYSAEDQADANRTLAELMRRYEAKTLGEFLEMDLMPDDQATLDRCVRVMGL